MATVTPKEVREWASENGFEMGIRGRIRQEVIDSFNKGRRAQKRYVDPLAK